MIIDILRNNPMRYKDAAGNWLPADQIAVLLCKPYEVANPTPQPNVPRIIDLDDALGVMSSESLAKLVNTDILNRFIDSCKDGDVESAKRLILLGVRTGHITAAEAEELVALDGEIPDPAWHATITLPAACASASVTEVEAALAEIGGAS